MDRLIISIDVITQEEYEIRFKTAQVYDYENGNPLIPSIEKYSRYKKQANGKFTLKNKMLNECWRMWSSCVITWDGKIVPCCFDKDAQHQLGDVSSSNFQQIWKSEAYQTFRKNILTNRQAIDFCKNCTKGTKVFEEYVLPIIFHIKNFVIIIKNYYHCNKLKI